MDYHGVLCEFVEMWDALDEDTASGGHGGDLAIADTAVDVQQWVCIVPHGVDLRHMSADNARGLLGLILLQVLREVRVGGERRLHGDDSVGGEVCDAGDCVDKGVSV